MGSLCPAGPWGDGSAPSLEAPHTEVGDFLLPRDSVVLTTPGSTQAVPQGRGQELKKLEDRISPERTGKRGGTRKPQPAHFTQSDFGSGSLGEFHIWITIVVACLFFSPHSFQDPFHFPLSPGETIFFFSWPKAPPGALSPITFFAVPSGMFFV